MNKLEIAFIGTNNFNVRYKSVVQRWETNYYIKKHTGRFRCSNIKEIFFHKKDNIRTKNSAIFFLNKQI